MAGNTVTPNAVADSLLSTTTAATVAATCDDGNAVPTAEPASSMAYTNAALHTSRAGPAGCGKAKYGPATGKTRRILVRGRQKTRRSRVAGQGQGFYEAYPETRR